MRRRSAVCGYGRPVTRAPAPVHLRTLTEDGQRAEDVAAELIAFLGAARESLDIALYSVRLPGPVGDAVAASLRDARSRGVTVRIAYNDPSGAHRDLVSPPPATRPELLADLQVGLRAIPGEDDLMHHKYVVRDRQALWCGSTNWSQDSWTHQENVILTVSNAALAVAYAENFEELWTRGRLEGTGAGATDAVPLDGEGNTVRPWFCPGRGEQLSHRIATAIGRADRRVRIASPVLTAGPVLGTLAEVTAEQRVDVAGICDATQMRHVHDQWAANDRSAWKMPLLARVLRDGDFTGKRSTPWGRATIHDFMHAKVTVADDVVFVGSFNLSRSGERNAENMLEFRHPALADRLSSYVDALRERYSEPVVLPH